LREKTFPLPKLSVPVDRSELVLMLKKRMERFPEAERSWRLAMMEQHVKKATRIDLIQAFEGDQGNPLR
jgi:hypothetical protein